MGTWRDSGHVGKARPVCQASRETKATDNGPAPPPSHLTRPPPATYRSEKKKAPTLVALRTEACAAAATIRPAPNHPLTAPSLPRGHTFYTGGRHTAR